MRVEVMLKDFAITKGKELPIGISFQCREEFARPYIESGHLREITKATTEEKEFIRHENETEDNEVQKEVDTQNKIEKASKKRKN